MHVRTEALDAEHRMILDVLASGTPTRDCLTRLTEAASRLQPDARLALLLPDSSRTVIDEVIGVRVPTALVTRLKGLPIDGQLIGTCAESLITGSVFECDDIAGASNWTEDWKDAFRSLGLRACHSTPVADSDGVVMASFVFFFDKPHVAEAWDARVGVFGSQIASLALARERAEMKLNESAHQIEAKLAEAELLATISTDLIHEEDTETLYAKLLSGAMTIMHADFASLQMFHPDRGDEGEMQLVAHHGFTPEAAEYWEWVAVGSGSSCGETLRSGIRSFVPDVETWEAMMGSPGLDMYRKTGMRAVQSTPLFNRSGRIVGMISTHWRHRHAPDEGALRLFDLLARQAADLLERRRADEAIRDRNRYLAVLSRVSARILLADQQDAGWVDDVFSEVATAIEAELFFTYLSDYETRTLHLASSGGLTDDQHAQFTTVKFGTYLCGAVAERREPIVVENLQAGAYPEAEALRREGVRCYAGVPLIANGQLIGTVSYAKKTRSRFTDEELQLVQSVCDQVAVTLDRVRLFSDLEASESRIRHITESMPQKVFTADADGNVDYFNQQWRKFTGLTTEQIRDWGWTQFVHPEDLDENLSVWRRSLRTGEPFELTHRFRRADGEWRWHLSRATALLDRAGKILMWAGANTDIHEQIEMTEALKQREAALAESEQRFRQMADHAPVMVWVTDADGACTFLSQSWYDFTGQTMESGLDFGWLDAVHPDDRADAEAAFRNATVERESFRLDYRLRQPDGEYRWALDAASPRVGPDGRFLGFIGSVIDITDRKQAEATQHLLIGELNHRVKNMLATVQSIMQQTLRRTSDPTTFAAAFGGRLQSLSRVHSLLSDTTWEGADIHQLARDQLLHGPIDESRVTIRGPHLTLEPQAALHLALILHELGTNAIKYGAHSTPSGRTEVAWTRNDGGLMVTWRERGGPPVSAPEKKGFGSRLIEAGASALGGTANMQIEPEGLTWTLTMALPAGAPPSKKDDHGSDKAPLSSAASSNGGSRHSLPLKGRHVLVVEDDALVGMDIVGELEGLGALVTGPLCTEDAALSAITKEPLEVALLDANLGGQPVDRISAALKAANVPFVFVTGYARENLPELFGSTPILPKPFTSEQLRTAVLDVSP